MKKYLVMGAALCVALAFTSCKSQESAYKKAYEKAKAQEEQQTAQAPTQDQATVTPMVTKQADQTTVSNVDNTPVRSEDVTLISGTGLKQFSVVVGSFGLKANAEGFQSLLKQGGYDAQIVFNASNNMYRVVSGTYDDKSQAVQGRDAIRGSKFNKNSDAWLLYKK
ncbi:MAG: SPOR domain-containing protein [Prevotella sp.]|jgi:cell division protein FtsN